MEMTWKDLSDDALLTLFASLEENKKDILDRWGHAEQELTRRLNDRKATAIMGSEFTMERGQNATYDRTKWGEFIDLLDTADLGKCYTAAYTPEPAEVKEVPESWNVTQLKPLVKKYGGRVKELFDASTGFTWGSPKLKARPQDSGATPSEIEAPAPDLVVLMPGDEGYEEAETDNAIAMAQADQEHMAQFNAGERDDLPF